MQANFTPKVVETRFPNPVITGEIFLESQIPYGKLPPMPPPPKYVEPVVPKKLDPQFIQTVVANIELGQTYFFPLAAMTVDADGNAWLDRCAVPLGKTSAELPEAVKKDHPAVLVVGSLSDQEVMVCLAFADGFKWLPAFISEAERGRWMPVSHITV